ncbi:MAG: hypothetical protein QNJ14_04010 [Woeseiaceae bacterium]|nr:hypothetical protein [Woeseiaceae bacterium]
MVNSKMQALLTALILVGLLIGGCGKTGSDKILEEYLLEEGTLDSHGWEYYAVEHEPSRLIAYLVFPESGSRSAPVASELQRICPDRKRHDFWESTDVASFEIVLINRVDHQRGKAKRLAQVTCDKSFDLAAFEESTLDSAVAGDDDTVASGDDVDTGEADSPDISPRYPDRPALPDADVPFYSIKTNLNINDPLDTTRYEFPPGELERMKELVEELKEVRIDTTGMRTYYPEFADWMDRLPHFRNAAVDPPDKEDYSRYHFQNGSIRVEMKVEGGEERVKKNVFYNLYGAPVVVIEKFGSNNARFFAAVLEYDAAGYISRVTHFSDGDLGVFLVSIYQVDADYDHVTKYDFENKDGEFVLGNVIRHTEKGSFTFKVGNGPERKYTSSRFSDSLRFFGKYPSLAPLLPIPEPAG